MQPHQQRVVDEKNELDIKIAALRKFIIESPKFAELKMSDRNLLGDQLGTMSRYSDILAERISRFT